MSTFDDYFSDDQGFLWVQPDGPNTTVWPLFCHDVDTFDEPQGGLSLRFCQDANGRWQVAHRSQASPGAVTFTIETWLPKTRTWLQRQAERRCPIPVYIHHATCPPSDAFLNYDAGQVVHWGVIEAKHKGNLARQRADAETASEVTMMSFDITGFPAPEYWPLVGTLRTSAEAEDIRDIAFCNTPLCYGGCGPAEAECTDGMIVHDEAAVAASIPYTTTDGGATWTAAGAGPFGNTEDMVSVICFHLDATTIRHIVANGTSVGGQLAETAYTDDGGTNWTIVTMGVATDYFRHGGSLWALNAYNIWAATVDEIFYSSDAGVTWTDQVAPAATGDWYAVHFIDENYGMAVGGSGVAVDLVVTTDGGEHWTAGTGTGLAAVYLTGVHVLDAQHAWATSSTGVVYYTNDFGTNWTARTLPVPAGSTVAETGDVSFLDHYMGAVCGAVNDGVDDHPAVWYTRNGGMDWEYQVYDTAFDGMTRHGLESVWICSYNQIFAVGEPVNSLGFIWELEIGGAP